MMIKHKLKENRRLHHQKDLKYEASRSRKMQIEERNKNLQNERRKVAQSLRIRRRQNDQKKYDFLNELKMKNQAKKELIKTQERQAFIRLENMKKEQSMNCKTLNKDLVVNERSVIHKREQEAQRLERLEAELLQNLQQTQNMEKEAFGQLENAMIEASKPKRDRVNKSRASRRSKTSSKHILL
jgi:hypothetical protein